MSISIAFHFWSLFFLINIVPSTFISSLILDFSLIRWCNIISYHIISILVWLANYASKSSYRCVSYVYVNLLIVVFLSMHTVHTLVDCLFVDCRFPIDILYILVTCRLSFSYQCIPYMYNMFTCWLSCSYWCTRNMCTRWLSFPIDASHMYMLKRWLYCVYNLFSNTHRLILMWTYIHAKRNVLVMI